MAKIALNKSALNQQTRRLKSYRQFVPALDMKRRQLMGARQQSRAALAEIESRIDEVTQEVGERIPMLNETALELTGLVSLKTVAVSETNLVGVHLPVLDALELEQSAYSRLLLPVWVDALVDLLRRQLELKVRQQLEQERLKRLEAALAKTTQRLNLFEKVLIPGCIRAIRRINIALSDAERDAVVRAKIAKDKRQRKGAAL